MPHFVDASSRAKQKWGYYPKHLLQEVLNLCARVLEMREWEGLTGTDLIIAFIRFRVLPLQQRCHLIGQMTGLQDPDHISNLWLAADHVTRRVNDISKARLRDDWEFGNPSYSQVNPAPVVSPWSPYFAPAHLLVRPDATREVLLNAIRHPYDRAPTQVVRAGLEEPTAHGEGEEEATADVGAGRRAAKFFFRIS